MSNLLPTTNRERRMCKDSLSVPPSSFMESISLSTPVSNSMTPTAITRDEKPTQRLTKIQIPLKTIGLILILTTLTLMLFGYTLIALLIIVPLRSLIRMMSNGKDTFFRLASVKKDGKHVIVPRIFHHQQ